MEIGFLWIFFLFAEKFRFPNPFNLFTDFACLAIVGPESNGDGKINSRMCFPAQIKRLPLNSH